MYILTILYFLMKLIYIISNEDNNRNFSFSEVHLVTQGTGEQNILNQNFLFEPYEVIINGKYMPSCKKSCNFENEINYVTMKFDIQIDNCNEMFSELSNIIEIDLSKFDTSKVTNMCKMFYNCTELKKINLENIDTSLVKDMSYMFAHLSSIKAIDASYLNTSNVETMLDMFASCVNVEAINVSPFNISKVKTMKGVFYHCFQLKYLDLSSFFISPVDDISYIFFKCNSLIFLNLENISFKSNVNKEEAFHEIPGNVKYCINDMDIINSIFGNNISSNCSDSCFKENIKIEPTQKICVESCGETEYKYEYNNICYDMCPEGTHSSYNNEYLCTDDIPEGFYFDGTENNYKICHNSCKTCYGPGDENNQNCIECKYYYYNQNNIFYCTESKVCPEQYKNLILEKNKCVKDCNKDSIFQYEYNNICYEFCPNRTYNNNYICEDCDIKCSSCSKDSVKNNLCLSCSDGYYPIYDYSLVEFKNCSKSPIGFYLDNDLF